jgi:hypothetical protein
MDDYEKVSRGNRSFDYFDYLTELLEFETMLGDRCH